MAGKARCSRRHRGETTSAPSAARSDGHRSILAGPFRDIEEVFTDALEKSGRAGHRRGRGIGEAIARAFAREGARVAVADIDPRTAASTARRLGAGRGLALHMDVADSARRWPRASPPSSGSGSDSTSRVTNAAIEPIVPFLELSEETWDRVLDTNLKGTFSSPRRRHDGWSSAAAASSSRLVRERGGGPPGVRRLRRLQGRGAPAHQGHGDLRWRRTASASTPSAPARW